MPSPLLHKSAQIKTSDASLDPEDSMQKIDPLKRRLPDRQRLPVLRGIVLEGINNIESGIELADRVQRTEKSIRSGLLAQDAAERQLKQLIREAEDGRKVMAENIKKLCAYMAHPEEPLDKFPSEEIPKNCSTL
ncbi:hypothetical protein FACS189441_2510 [Betaproteobacteria bacterium]|nr:hypothetical protein FACS189441_2510 [Betaproteobacteria bacterium]